MMYALLKQANSDELMSLAAIGNGTMRAAVEAELDRRAGVALVRRILAAAPHRRPGARASAKSLVAA